MSERSPRPLRRLLGIDPGSRTTGWGVIEQRDDALALVACGTVRLPGDAPIATRLARIHAEVGALIAGHQPAAVGLEEAFVGMNVRSTIRLAEARAACLLAAAQAGIEVHEVPPALVKKSVSGHGRAGKEAVRRAVLHALGAGEEAAPPYDAADALAIAVCVLRRLDTPLPLQGAGVGRRGGRRGRGRGGRWTAEDLQRLEREGS